MMIFRYAIFALFSIFVNLLSQFTTLLFYSGFLSLYLAMSMGTFAGLLVKYILDKKYIFFYTTKNRKDDGKKFFLYSLMGVFTTLIFWGFEIGFDLCLETPNAKYIGAVVGLSVGYVIKYFLDKKFVFREN